MTVEKVESVHAREEARHLRSPSPRYGRDVTWAPPNRWNVNTPFAGLGAAPHLTIHEDVAFNVAVGVRRKRVEDAEIKARVGEMLGLVELAGSSRRTGRRS